MHHFYHQPHQSNASAHPRDLSTQPDSTIISFHLPCHVFRNPHTSNTTHSIILDTVLSCARLVATIAAGACGLAYLAALTYYTYVTAHSLHATAKPPPPAYVPIYCIFCTVVERTAPLCQQCRWL